MVDMGISSKIMKYLSLKCNMTFWDLTPSIDQTLYHTIFGFITELNLITDFDLITKFREVRTLQWVRLANRGRLLLRTPGPVPFVTCICSNVDVIFS